MTDDARMRELHHFETEQALMMALAALDADLPDPVRIQQARDILRRALT